jgi:hypothetical protein
VAVLHSGQKYSSAVGPCPFRSRSTLVLYVLQGRGSVPPSGPAVLQYSKYSRAVGPCHLQVPQFGLRVRRAREDERVVRREVDAHDLGLVHLRALRTAFYVARCIVRCTLHCTLHVCIVRCTLHCTLHAALYAARCEPHVGFNWNGCAQTATLPRMRGAACVRERVQLRACVNACVAYLRTHVRMYEYMHSFMHTHTYAPTHARTHACVPVRSCMRSCMKARVHACVDERG